MTDCWVFVAKRENESVSDTIDIIKRNSWDFVPKSDNIPPPKPAKGDLLEVNDLVIFYYSFDKSIIAKARIKSRLYSEDNKWWVGLKDVEIFNPIKIEKPREDLKINHPGSIYPMNCGKLKNILY